MANNIKTSLEQRSIDCQMQMREELILRSLKPECARCIPANKRPSECPFKISHFQADKVAEFVQEIHRINSELVTMQWNYHYKYNLNHVRLSHAGAAGVALEKEEIAFKVRGAVQDFMELFRGGKTDIRKLPLPDKPHFFPQEHERLDDEDPVNRKDHESGSYRYRLQTKFNRSANAIEESILESCKQYNKIIANVGSLYQQVKLCAFMQKKYGHIKPLNEFTLIEFNQFVKEFAEYEKERTFVDRIRAVFVDQAEEQEPPQNSVQVKKKKKKKKTRAQAAAPALEQVVKPALKVEPAKVPIIPQEMVDLCLRLNHFNDYNGCAPHERLQRWGTISLDQAASIIKIKHFVDFDAHNQPRQLYLKCPLAELRQHKENHDIPIHTILREKGLVSRYSFHYTYTNHAGEKRDTRVFYAEKLSYNEEGNLQSESGLINAAVDSQGVVYHCMFKKTKSVALEELMRRYTDPSAPQAGDEKEEERNFQFQGNYNIEIDPANETLVIKIGQDGSPHQVVYRLYPLT